MKKIYTITTFRTKARINYLETPRVVGWFPTSQEAIDYMKSDRPIHLNEAGYYTHALIEEVGTDVYPSTKDIMWFNFDRKKNQWIQIHRPQQYENGCNFSIG